MWVFAVDSDTKSCLAMPATLMPSASRRSTWLSRGDSCGPAGASRRFIASARSAAVKADGDEAACRAAATTSSAGAVLGTNADAPASSAPKSWSSPAYMVSTTMPTCGLDLRRARVASRPLPSGRREPACRTASAQVPASPTTSKLRSRSNACRRPLRIRSWSSTSSTLVRVAGAAGEVVILGGLPRRCRSWRTSSVCGAQHHGYGRPAGSTRCDLELAPDTFRPLRHDRKTEAALRTVGTDSGTVIGDLDSSVRRIDLAAYPEV